MNLPERRDVRFPFPELLEWVENPMFGFRPFGQLVRVEDYIADDRYVLRAELPGVDPEEDIEVTVDGGMLHIRAEKTHRATEPHRSEFAYGALSRTVTLLDHGQDRRRQGRLQGRGPGDQRGAGGGEEGRGRRIAVEH
ncbi:Hsp20/alpha crystallin family protein [Nonomuraea ferruginea]